MLSDVHHVDDYGADPTGRDPSDDAFDAAVEAAEDGGWIALTNGNYYLARRHVIRKELVVCGAGGTIESDLHPGHGYHDYHRRGEDADGTQTDSLYPIVAFRGERGDRVPLDGPVREGSDRVSVADPSAFEVGGGVLLCNEDLDRERRVGAVGERTRTYEPTVSTIRAIDGTDLYLDVPARYDHDPDDHHVYPLAMLDGCGFLECHFRNRHDLYWDDELGKVMGGFRHAMLHAYCRAPFVRNCSVRGYDTKMWVPIDVLEARVINPRAERPMNVNGAHGEPLYVLGSTNVNIYNPVIRGARRAIDVRAGCKDVNVYDPDITGVTFLGLSYHHGYGDHVRGNLNVYGGRVYCKPTDPLQDDHGGEGDRRWELQRGDGMRGTGANGRVHVRGTTFLVRRHGATCYGSGTVIDGCEFTTVPEGTGTSGPVLSITGSNVTIRNTVVRGNRHGTDHGSAVRIEDADDVDIDVRIRGRFAGTPVDVEGGERIRLSLRSSASGGQEAVRIDGAVRDLRLTGDAYTDAAGVSIASDAETAHVRITDFTHRGDGDALQIDPDAAVANLRIDRVTSVNGGDIALGDTLIDGLWIRDSVFGCLRGVHSEQSSNAPTVVEGNRRGTGDASGEE